MTKILTIQKVTFRCLLVRETKYLIKELELSALPPTSREVRGWRPSSIINGQWFNQLCLSNEVAIRNPKRWGSESFQIGEHMKFWGGWLPWRGLGSSCPFPHALLFLAHHERCGILIPWPRIEPMSPALETWSLSHWTTREVPWVESFCNKWFSWVPWATLETHQT